MIGPDEDDEDPRLTPNERAAQAQTNSPPDDELMARFWDEHAC